MTDVRMASEGAVAHPVVPVDKGHPLFLVTVSFPFNISSVYFRLNMHLNGLRHNFTRLSADTYRQVCHGALYAGKE